MNRHNFHQELLEYSFQPRSEKKVTFSDAPKYDWSQTAKMVVDKVEEEEALHYTKKLERVGYHLNEGEEI